MLAKLINDIDGELKRPHKKPRPLLQPSKAVNKNPRKPKIELLFIRQHMLWQPTFGRKNMGRQRETYVDTLFKDTGLKNVNEVAIFMGDCDV